MDLHAIEYYSVYSEPGPHGHFHRVIPLHEEPLFSWEEATAIVPTLCRGWFELAHLPLADRIEFTRDFWVTKLPYHPCLNEFLTQFFASLDDVGIFITQQKYEDPFIPHLVYSLANNNGFFHGEIGATENEIIDLQKEFSNYILPQDYLAFLRIHNGFAKQTDTGIIPSTKMKDCFIAFQKIIQEDEQPLMSAEGRVVNPSSLIPFYDSFGMPFFQCFWDEWYPGQEMGNIYYSTQTRTISTCQLQNEGAETLAFQTFTDWLMFYLEKIE